MLVGFWISLWLLIELVCWIGLMDHELYFEYPPIDLILGEREEYAIVAHEGDDVWIMASL